MRAHDVPPREEPSNRLVHNRLARFVAAAGFADDMASQLGALASHFEHYQGQAITIPADSVAALTAHLRLIARMVDLERQELTVLRRMLSQTLLLRDGAIREAIDAGADG